MPGLTRALSLTLLVVLGRDEALARVEEIIARVGQALPLRALVISLDEEEPRASLSNHCRPDRDGQATACWEEVRLLGGGRSTRRVLSAAQALVLPNLPIHAWWPASSGLDDPLIPRIIEIADHIIVDAVAFRDPIRELGRYAQHAEYEHGTVAFADLTWRRLEPWRLNIAQLFDDAADLAFLSGLETVVLDYEQPRNGSNGQVAEPLLLVCWLASRLGWIPVVPPQGLVHAPRHLTFENGAEGVHVELRRREVANGGGGLIRAELRAYLDGRSATYTVNRQGDDATVSVDRDGERSETRVQLPPASQADLLRSELGSFGRDRIFEATLQVLRLLAPRS
jgi:glucose-6-phosphate dehydrogenase assembly protein OpcA